MNTKHTRDLDPTFYINAAGELTPVPIEEFYNQCHDAKGRFCETGVGVSGKAPSDDKVIGQAVNRIGIFGPSSRFRKKDLRKLSDAELRRLHAHLETNSRKWGAVITAFTIVTTLIGIGFGLPLLGPAISTMSTAFLTRTRERFAVGQEAQRRKIHLRFSNQEMTVEFSEKTANEELDGLLSDIGNKSPKEIIQALNDGLQAIQDLLDDPEEELTKEEQKSLKYGQTAFKKAIEKMTK